VNILPQNPQAAETLFGSGTVLVLESTSNCSVRAFISLFVIASSLLLCVLLRPAKVGV